MSDTVQKMLLAHAEQDTPGLKFGDRTWTWREYVAESTARANAITELADRDRPAHVGLLMENTPEMVMALAAGALGGYISAGINLTRRGDGLAHDIRKADCQILLTDTEHLVLLEGLDLDGVRVIDTDGQEWQGLVETGRGMTKEHREVDTSETFMLIFTSGTSGDPKAVQVANYMAAIAGQMLAQKYELGYDDTCYIAMPLFHSNAVLSGWSVAVACGAAMGVAPRFTASSFLDDVRRYGATYMNYVGKPLAYVLATPTMDDDADNPLKHAFGNEASDRDQQEFAERFGCDVWDGFGSTETAVIITRDENTPPGSIGTPFPGVAVYDRVTRQECPRAVFDENGRVANLDEAVGELVNTEGAGYFAGYYNDEQATRARLDGGMYWSGDLGYRDSDGYVYLAGRTTDWLRVDGENMAAGPIEQILMRHPAVNQVVVYGIPDPHAGDQLMAAMVLRESTLTPESLEAFLAEQPDLSPKAWPRFVRIADELPSTATNKVLKRELVQQATDVDGDTLWMREERGRAYAAGAPVGPVR